MHKVSRDNRRRMSNHRYYTLRIVSMVKHVFKRRAACRVGGTLYIRIYVYIYTYIPPLVHVYCVTFINPRARTLSLLSSKITFLKEFLRNYYNIINNLKDCDRYIIL